LDKELETYIRDNDGIPALKNYRPSFKFQPYQWAICVVRNEETVYGIPVKLLAPSYIITIDLVVEYQGWYADTARTFTHADCPTKRQFVEVSQLIFAAALEAIAPQQPINLFGVMVESAAKLQGYSIVREFCGHGIGKAIHTNPQIMNYDAPSAEVFEVGKSYAVEPILAVNNHYNLREADDGWTVIADCLTSHNEDTIFVGKEGIVNLTGNKS
jgi:methionyl aminopeptidase